MSEQYLTVLTMLEIFDDSGEYDSTALFREAGQWVFRAVGDCSRVIVRTDGLDVLAHEIRAEVKRQLTWDTARRDRMRALYKALRRVT